MSLPTATIALPAKLRHDQAMAWLDGLRLPTGADGATVIDASALASFDSTALACLIEVRRRAQILGTSVQITGLPDRLQRLAKVYGLADLL